MSSVNITAFKNAPIYPVLNEKKETIEPKPNQTASLKEEPLPFSLETEEWRLFCFYIYHLKKLDENGNPIRYEPLDPFPKERLIYFEEVWKKKIALNCKDSSLLALPSLQDLCAPACCNTPAIISLVGSFLMSVVLGYEYLETSCLGKDPKEEDKAFFSALVRPFFDTTSDDVDVRMWLQDPSSLLTVSRCSNAILKHLQKIDKNALEHAFENRKIEPSPKQLRNVDEKLSTCFALNSFNFQLQKESDLIKAKKLKFDFLIYTALLREFFTIAGSIQLQHPHTQNPVLVDADRSGKKAFYQLSMHQIEIPNAENINEAAIWKLLYDMSGRHWTLQNNLSEIIVKKLINISKEGEESLKKWFLKGAAAKQISSGRFWAMLLQSCLYLQQSNDAAPCSQRLETLKQLRSLASQLEEPEEEACRAIKTLLKSKMPFAVIENFLQLIVFIHIFDGKTKVWGHKGSQKWRLQIDLGHIHLDKKNLPEEIFTPLVSYIGKAKEHGPFLSYCYRKLVDANAMQKEWAKTEELKKELIQFVQSNSSLAKAFPPFASDLCFLLKNGECGFLPLFFSSLTTSTEKNSLELFIATLAQQDQAVLLDCSAYRDAAKNWFTILLQHKNCTFFLLKQLILSWHEEIPYEATEKLLNKLIARSSFNGAASLLINCRKTYRGGWIFLFELFTQNYLKSSKQENKVLEKLSEELKKFISSAFSFENFRRQNSLISSIIQLTALREKNFLHTYENEFFNIGLECGDLLPAYLFLELLNRNNELTASQLHWLIPLLTLEKPPEPFPSRLVFSLKKKIQALFTLLCKEKEEEKSLQLLAWIHFHKFIQPSARIHSHYIFTHALKNYSLSDATKLYIEAVAGSFFSKKQLQEFIVFWLESLKKTMKLAPETALMSAIDLLSSSKTANWEESFLLPLHIEITTIFFENSNSSILTSSHNSLSTFLSTSLPLLKSIYNCDTKAHPSITDFLSLFTPWFQNGETLLPLLPPAELEGIAFFYFISSTKRGAIMEQKWLEILKKSSTPAWLEWLKNSIEKLTLVEQGENQNSSHLFLLESSYMQLKRKEPLFLQLVPLLIQLQRTLAMNVRISGEEYLIAECFNCEESMSDGLALLSHIEPSSVSRDSSDLYKSLLIKGIQTLVKGAQTSSNDFCLLFCYFFYLCQRTEKESKEAFNLLSKSNKGIFALFALAFVKEAFPSKRECIIHFSKIKKIWQEKETLAIADYPWILIFLPELEEHLYVQLNDSIEEETAELLYSFLRFQMEYGLSLKITSKILNFFYDLKLRIKNYVKQSRLLLILEYIEFKTAVIHVYQNLLSTDDIAFIKENTYTVSYLSLMKKLVDKKIEINNYFFVTLQSILEIEEADCGYNRCEEIKSLQELRAVATEHSLISYSSV